MRPTEIYSPVLSASGAWAGAAEGQEGARAFDPAETEKLVARMIEVTDAMCLYVNEYDQANNSYHWAQ